MASRLADIYKSEIGRGGGLGSAIGKRIGEKIDPRQMFDQSGLLTAMFPSLKTYNATAKKPGTKREESDKGVSSGMMGAVLASSNLTAKNTMVLPAMARDMNLMRQNVAKLVKLQGGKPAMKGDMFFKKAGERNTIFESALGKMGGITAKGGKGLNLFGIGTEKDGQTPETALYVKSAGEDEQGGLLKALTGGTGSVLKTLASIAGSIVSSPTFIAAAAIGGTALLARFMKNQNDKELKKPENANVPLNMVRNEQAETLAQAAAQNQTQAIAAGGLTTGTANDIVKRLIEDKLKGAAADNFCNDVVRGSNLALVLDKCSSDMKQRYLEMVAKDTAPAPAPAIPTPPPAPTPVAATSVPDTTDDARRGRGYIPPATPSNAVVSGTGGTISTGSGGMVVSPSYGPTPAQLPMPTPAPSPTPETTRPVTSNPSEGESAVRAAAAKYGITDPTELNALLAQVAHESGDYKYLTELGGRKYFDKYEGRRDLGNTQPGDGYKYRGRGYIQLTGRDNYTAFSKFSGIDVVNNPDLVSTPSVGAEAALWFWQKRVKPKVKDFNDVKAVTQVVNGGQNGIADRTRKFETLMASSTQNITPYSSSSALAAAPSSSIPAGTQIASASSEVTAARYSGRTQMRPQAAPPVVVNASGSGDTKILTTQRATPYNGEFYASLVSNKSL